MADNEDKRIFRQESLKGLHSPDDLDSYVVANRPWWWAVVVGISILVACFLGWMCFGHLPRTATMKGMVTDPLWVTAYADTSLDVDDLEGAFVNVTHGGRSVGTGKVLTFDGHPYSKKELEERLSSDWMVANLVTDSFMRRLVIQMDEPLEFEPGDLCDVTITISDKRMVEYLFGRD